jgi:hypothetical protein
MADSTGTLDTQPDRIQVSTQGKGVTKVIEVPVDKPLQWDMVYGEIKSGIWAVALAAVVLWVATAKIRGTAIELMKQYAKRHIDVLDAVQDMTKENNSILKRVAQDLDDQRRRKD